MSFRKLRHPWHLCAALSAVLAAASCSRPVPEAPFRLAQRDRLCAPTQATQTIPERAYRAGSRPNSGQMSFGELRDAVNSACMSCHRAPSRTGGFTYIDSYAGQELTLGGVTAYIQGIHETAEKMAESIFHGDPKKRMPPEDRRVKNPEGFEKIGRDLQAWIAAGKPDGSFSRAGSAVDPAAQQRAPLVFSSEVGDCVPLPEAIGFDLRRDRMFEKAEKLPQDLRETDLFSLDAFELANKGTVAYTVEYPLWADNADKARWIHVPSKIEGNRVVQQKIAYDPYTKQFKIPENTRFYKNFYKLVKDREGKSWYRRIETRIIVVRYGPKQSLFGTYRWDDSEQVATLVDIPYRDGTPFKDVSFKLIVDEKKGKTRTYAIPGRHRCLECHMGSTMDSLVLGFTPLQINRRRAGEGGREDHPGPADLSQAERLVSYGLIEGYRSHEELPRLEWFGPKNPRNKYEIQAQGYFYGNCAHCHNPKGFAFTKENGITLDFSPGEIYEFNTHLRSTQRVTRPQVHHEGDPERSHIFLKVADPPSAQGMTSRMPMHTPGTPDCRALRVIGKWIKTWEGIAAAEAWEPNCPKQDDVQWIDQDFTWPQSDQYAPRRADWNDPKSGMPSRFRELELTRELRDTITKPYAVGYWNRKEGCKFPETTLPAEKQRPWMLTPAGKPKKPFGEVYSTTPGAWYFRTTCAKCHGTQADGDTALARGILNWSGGSVRVANLIDGMFGKQGANLSAFDVGNAFSQRNLSGNYLIWMAMEGTLVQFPPEASNFMGRHGAQMLNQVRDKCLRQISPEKASSPNFPDHEIFREVCFIGNRSPQDPELQFDPRTGKPRNPEIVEQWLDRAAFNAGWAIYQFLLDASRGDWKPGNDECERVHPAVPRS